MRGGWLLLALAAVAAGGCGQKGPLYLPDKSGKVVTSAPAAPAEAAPAPAPDTPKAAPPKPTDKDQDQETQPPK